jgi:RNA polymerase sigma factor (TIGR02999 family)
MDSDPRSDPSEDTINKALEAVRAGDSAAAGELVTLLYRELRQMARVLLSKRPPGQTLQPTALVHEVYMQLAGRQGRRFESAAHFFNAAARAMRDILVDQARRKAALKRGGGRQRIDLEPEMAAIEPPVDDMLALDEALRRLEKEDPRKAEIVRLRYFAGLSVPETAELLGVSVTTVEREFRYTRAWLLRELGYGVSPLL